MKCLTSLWKSVSNALIVLLKGFEDKSPRDERNRLILAVNLSYQDLKLDRMRQMIFAAFIAALAFPAP